MSCILIYIIVLTFNNFCFFKSLFTVCKGGPKISLGVQIFHPISEILVPWGSKYFETSGPRVQIFQNIWTGGSIFGGGGGVQIFHDRTIPLEMLDTLWYNTVYLYISFLRV